MEQININTELKEWLIDYITHTIHNMRCDDNSFDNQAFNNWAKTFKREEAAFVVNKDFDLDWGDNMQDYTSKDKASEYAQTLLQIILDNWCL